MLPVTTGVIPFGAVMGTVAADAGLSFFQSAGMNLILYAGASQLAALDLMTKHAAAIVIVLTGLIINLRFLLYSAAMAPFLQGASPLRRFLVSFSLTDQNYAVMMANQDILKTKEDNVEFYLGGALAMFFAWHLSVAAGYAFGNFAPASLALDYAVPLSFIALVVPTIRNRKYLAVASVSTVSAILLHSLPYRTGLLLSAMIAIAFAALLTRRKA